MIFREAKLNIVHEVLAKQQPAPKVILEFGTFVGTSAIGWGATLRELNGQGGDGGGIHVYTFDLDENLVKIARDLVKLAGLDDVVTVLGGPGSDSLRQLVADGKVKAGEVDMVFIDHWEKYYVPDLRLCEELRLFRKGSVAVADNTDMPGAPDYLAYVKKGGSGESGAVRYESTTYYAAAESGPVSVLSKYLPNNGQTNVWLYEACSCKKANPILISRPSR